MLVLVAAILRVIPEFLQAFRWNHSWLSVSFGLMSYIIVHWHPSRSWCGTPGTRRRETLGDGGGVLLRPRCHKICCHYGHPAASTWNYWIAAGDNGASPWAIHWIQQEAAEEVDLLPRRSIRRRIQRCAYGWISGYSRYVEINIYA